MMMMNMIIQNKLIKHKKELVFLKRKSTTIQNES